MNFSQANFLEPCSMNFFLNGTIKMRVALLMQLSHLAESMQSPIPILISDILDSLSEIVNQRAFIPADLFFIMWHLLEMQVLVSVLNLWWEVAVELHDCPFI